MILKKKLYKYMTIFRQNSTKNINSIWESVVGLEIHAQIRSASKLFSGSATTYTAPVNTNVSPLDASIPGTLPVLNKRCVEAGVLTAVALNCKVNPISYFDRKHYFYADLPTGYQITQQRTPLAVQGKLEFLVYTPGIHKTPYNVMVNLKQLQLEQDSGKSLHDDTKSLVDLNRAGIPLMELVFDPELKDGEEAAALVKELRLILSKIDTCSCKMEEGALRVDANVSVNRVGEPLGVRTEVKNIGSIRGVAAAVDYEIKRQIKIKESGGSIINETRGWDSVKKITLAMRDKEVLQDYRYMPEPNLPPLHVAMGPINNGCVNVDKIKEQIPELPGVTRKRLRTDYGLSLEHTIMLVNDPALLRIFEENAQKYKISYKLLVNFLVHEFYTLLKKKNMNTEEINCPILYIGETVELMDTRKISRVSATFILQEIIEGNEKSPLTIVTENDLFQITDEKELEEICQKTVNEMEKAVKDYRKGKKKAFQAIIGTLIKKNERVDTLKCIEILKEILNK